jgi:hypothetical protein
MFFRRTLLSAAVVSLFPLHASGDHGSRAYALPPQPRHYRIAEPSLPDECTRQLLADIRKTHEERKNGSLDPDELRLIIDKPTGPDLEVLVKQPGETSFKAPYRDLDVLRKLFDRSYASAVEILGKIGEWDEPLRKALCGSVKAYAAVYQDSGNAYLGRATLGKSPEARRALKSAPHVKLLAEIFGSDPKYLDK